MPTGNPGKWVAPAKWAAVATILLGAVGALYVVYSPQVVYSPAKASISAKEDLLGALQEEKPDIILVGNSMQGVGIDFRSLSNQVGMKVFNAEHAGAMTIWQYGVLQYVLPKVQKKPKMVVVVERMNNFTCPQKRARAYQAEVKAMAGNEDWSVAQRLAVNGEGQPQLDGETTALDGFFWDFEKSVNWSLLPYMIQSARRGGYQLVIVRHKPRDLAERPDWYPPEMQKYADDMAYYLQANNVPFLDYDRQKALEGALYANGDHFNTKGKQVWTGLLAADLKALLAGKTAPNQHLPPGDYKSSAQLAAIATSMPVLPEPPPPPPHAESVRSPGVQPAATSRPAPRKT